MATERNVVDFKIHNLTEEQFQELKAQGKIDPNAVYCTPDESLKRNQITNCITEIPQDIKLELADGVLTLKAGSKYYKPDGTYVVTTSDYNVPIAWNSAASGIIVIGNDSYACYAENRQLSGATNPTGLQGNSFLFWNTTENKMYWTINGGSAWKAAPNCSVPIARVTWGADNKITSINEIYNGFGYMGSTIFSLPGVKGLIPNGRNADGTLKNIAISSTSVKVTTLTSAFSANLTLNQYATVGTYSVVEYDSDKNINYNSVNPIIQRAVVGRATFGSGGKVTSFEIKPAFHAVDYSDFETLSETVETNNDNAVHKTGDETINGTKTFLNTIVAGAGTGVAIKGTDYSYTMRSSGAISNGCGLFLNNSADNPAFVATNTKITVGNNNIVPFAVTPPSTDDSTRIATTAWVNTRLGGTGITSTEIGYLDGVTSAIQTQLNGKANTAASNFTAAGKGTIVNLTVPNYSAGVAFTLNKSTSYTAPKDGFVFIHTSRANDQYSNIKIGGTQVGYSMAYYANIQYFFPVAKGTVVSTDYDTIGSAIFYPLKGAI